MEQYILKSALVREIKRIMNEENENINSFEQHKNTSEKQRYNTRMALLEHILSFLDAIEVKDINIEYESELIANGIMIGVQANKYHTNIYNTKRNDFNHSHLCFAAKKGIELGLKIQQGK